MNFFVHIAAKLTVVNLARIVYNTLVEEYEFSEEKPNGTYKSGIKAVHRAG